ncbi:DUF1653 domain-containing protein [Brevibacillus choshinensis]|uniref:DUF1653 domain-containing protein n=1 Tax=Brevibacillus choshinensis TaxID=54911 RepID=UPI002E1BB7E3|nr:DUF1653 domain-containing protein [Brevibacillus choshinensis]MED4750097.1 DUF1653 domain-containing protein [Brevibacillus choshinensis]MED4780683.1 DUF1653 domain-containing protein [Brevibacillus choshinensis]
MDRNDNDPTLYRHYKGGVYKVTGIATHTETDEKMVVYYRVEDEELFVRPFRMFFEKVEVNGKKVPRFEKMN